METPRGLPIPFAAAHVQVEDDKRRLHPSWIPSATASLYPDYTFAADSVYISTLYPYFYHRGSCELPAKVSSDDVLV